MVFGHVLGLHDIYLCTKAPCGLYLGRVPGSHLALTMDLASMAHPQGQYAALIFILSEGGGG